MKILLILLAASAASAGLLGSKKCTWGPTYWCQGFQTSRECSATQHCIQRVWSQRQLPEDNDEVCDICKNMVGQARDTLRSNETQEELKEVFEGSCSLIPLRVIADECKNLADQFIPELVDTLSSEMDPNLVCATAGLCNSARIDKMLAEANAPATDCDMCKAETKRIGETVRNADKNLVVDKMLEVCGHFSSYSDACRFTVLDNFDLIYNMITQMEEGVCLLSGMCSESFQNVPSTFTSTSGEDIQCEFCEKVIQHWVDTWTANTTEEEFKTVLESLCKKLDKPSRIQHCLHIVDDWYLPWFNYLLHEVNPKELCGFVGLCHAQGLDSSAGVTLLFPTETEMTRLRPANGLVGNDELNYANTLEGSIAEGRLIGGYFAPKTVVATSKPSCTLCEYTLHELQNWLGDDKTEANVEAGLHKICSKLPHTVEGGCDHFVSTYGPALVQMIIHEIDPSEMCSRLQLCTGNILQEQLAVSDVPAIQMLRRETEQCTLCEYAMDTMFSVLNDTSDQEMVKNLLDTMCYKLMPASISNECEKLVSEYTNEIINLVIANFTPDQVCSGLQLCSPDKYFEIESEKEEEVIDDDFSLTVKDEKCILCEYAITTLDKYIGDKHNQAQIKAELENLCSHMPRSIKDQCTTFVDTYSDMIIDMIAHDLTPDQICAQLHLCKADVAPEPETERPYCTLCEYAIGEVDQLITDKKNEEEIKNVLDTICYHLSQPVQKPCTAMVTKWADKIIELFVAEYTPAQVCQEIRLCKPTVSQHYQIGNSIATNEIYTTNEIPPMEEVAKFQSQSPKCVICEFVMSVIDKNLILSNATLWKTRRMVQMVCDYLPVSTQTEEKCEDFIAMYGDQIIKKIMEEQFEPKEICTELTMCVRHTAPTQKPSQQLIGGHPCVWGPALWCQSTFHAKACGTTEHCQKYVWGREEE